MLDRLLYYYSKLMAKLQYPSIRDSRIDRTASVGARSNIIRVELGRYSYMGVANSVSDARIGSFCSIASYCAIGGGGHPIGWVSTSPVFYEGRNAVRKNFSDRRLDVGQPVHIGNDVWIGEKCFIKSGITIGDGAVIGAHSVVLDDIPAYAVAVGCPAKVVRSRFDQDIVDRLLAIRWWDFSDEMLAAYAPYFHDPRLFIERYGSKTGSALSGRENGGSGDA